MKALQSVNVVLSWPGEEPAKHPCHLTEYNYNNLIIIIFTHLVPVFIVKYVIA